MCKHIQYIHFECKHPASTETGFQPCGQKCSATTEDMDDIGEESCTGCKLLTSKDTDIQFLPSLCKDCEEGKPIYPDDTTVTEEPLCHVAHVFARNPGFRRIQWQVSRDQRPHQLTSSSYELHPPSPRTAVVADRFDDLEPENLLENADEKPVTTDFRRNCHRRSLEPAPLRLRTRHTPEESQQLPSPVQHMHRNGRLYSIEAPRSLIPHALNLKPRPNPPNSTRPQLRINTNFELVRLAPAPVLVPPQQLFPTPSNEDWTYDSISSLSASSSLIPSPIAIFHNAQSTLSNDTEVQRRPDIPAPEPTQPCSPSPSQSPEEQVFSDAQETTDGLIPPPTPSPFTPLTNIFTSTRDHIKECKMCWCSVAVVIIYVVNLICW